MKAFKFILLICICQFSLLAQSDKTESPYFIVSEGNSTSTFPLESTIADVIITGPIADVTVKQTYSNNGKSPIEAIYVFPASTRAAVYSIEMKVGDRTIIADIQEKQQARRTYETAKSEGKRASLLEQHRPNVFQMNVANIMPGDQIEVTLKYTEFIIPEDQIYTFTYPTVVGPRYTGEKKEAFAGIGYTKKGTDPLYNFDISVELNMSVPIKKINSPSHTISIKKSGGSATINLKKDDGKNGNRDYILNYKLVGDDVSTGIQVYNGKDESFFLCQMEPPKMECNPVVTPREYIFIIDVSGSMRGFPLDISKALMKNLFAGMSSNDKFNVMFFAGSAFVLHQESLPATRSNINHAFNQIDTQQGGGGTNMLKAINSALAIPKTPNYSRSFVIVTDGYVSVEEEVFHTIGKNLGNANFFAFGIGSSVNRHIIEGIAHVGRAEPFVVTERKFAKSQASRLKKYIETPVLTDIKITGRGLEMYDIIPSNIPDLMAERPIYFFGKYKKGSNPRITISGNNSGQKYTETLLFPESQNTNSEALAYLWAREKIRYLDDFNTLRSNPNRIEEITELGLQYNLLTKYTSFVAVDDIIINSGGIQKTIKQALPLPQGVSNSAIGFEMELDEVIHYNGTAIKAIDIETTLTDAIQIVLIETIITTWVESKPSNEIVKYLGSSLQVSLNEDGTLVIFNNGQRVRDLEKLINTQLSSIGYVQLVPFEIRISQK